MRIAVCISGQPRTWNKCYQTWNNLFSKFDAEVDYFYHLWDFNSLPQILNDLTPQPVSQQELDDIQSVLKPKKFLIENYEKSMKVMNDIRDAGRKYPLSGGTPVHWSGSQFYSIMRASQLKRSYELENNIEYDVCFKMRTDLYFTPMVIHHFVNEFETPAINTIYSCHNSHSGIFPPFRIGDIFYYSNSITFDVLSEFYRFLPIVGIRPFGHDDNPPEVPFTFYIKMMQIKNKRKYVDPKVMRTEEYAVKKEAQGSGAIGGHELI